MKGFRQYHARRPSAMLVAVWCDLRWRAGFTLLAIATQYGYSTWCVHKYTSHPEWTMRKMTEGG